ncbi:hypothetical protein AD006_32480 (plasmid) [Pseudonocardia sp. EC080610-09]|nr:hypothetical protein AD006_32480 [Pseudonocardia sp. EC080610-09]
MLVEPEQSPDQVVLVDSSLHPDEVEDISFLGAHARGERRAPIRLSLTNADEAAVGLLVRPVEQL